MNEQMTYKDIICDANNLYKAYENSIRGSKWKGSSQRFSLNRLVYIFNIQDALYSQTITNDPVKEFILSERGRLRAISSLSTKDRVVRHVLCDNILMPKIKTHIIYDNGSSVKGRGLDFQRKRFEVHLRRYYKEYGANGYILFGDFSKFYDNMQHNVVRKQLLDLLGYDEYLDWLITLILDGFKIDASGMSDEEYRLAKYGIFNKIEYRKMANSKIKNKRYLFKSVNIGDQFSQDLGTFYPHPIDNYVKYVRSQKYYGRFVDDWYIMNPNKDELNDILENIYRIADNLGIHINKKKTRIVKMSGTYKFLQIRYTLTKKGKIRKRINPKRVVAMRRKLKKLRAKVQSSELSYEDVECVFKSWMGSFYKLISKKQRENMIKLYCNLYDCEITIINHKMIIKKHFRFA